MIFFRFKVSSNESFAVRLLTIPLSSPHKGYHLQISRKNTFPVSKTDIIHNDPALILDQSSCIRFCIRYIKILIKSDLTFCLLFSFNICMLSFFNSTVYSPFSDSFFTGLLLSRNVTGFSCFRVFITMQG